MAIIETIDLQQSITKRDDITEFIELKLHQFDLVIEELKKMDIQPASLIKARQQLLSWYERALSGRISESTKTRIRLLEVHALIDQKVLIKDIQLCQLQNQLQQLLNKMNYF